MIVKHPGCPKWGLGFLVEERDGKRFYDFEDGLNHSIAKAFWSKLEPVHLDDAAATALEAKIRRLRDRPAPAPARKPRTQPPQNVPTFDAQLEAFAQQFEGGFAGAQFVAEERGERGSDGPPQAKKKAKAFKQAAIDVAQSLLRRDELEKLLAAGDTDAFMARIRDVHKAAIGLLHPLGDVIPFNKMPADRHRAFADAAFALLYGPDDFAARFDRLVAVLAEGKLATWPLATILPAIVSPAEHVFVKPSFFERQAYVVGYDLAYDRVPNAAAYARMLGLAREMERRLRAAGHAPRDLMDVYSFMWRTVAPPKPAAPSKPAAAKSS